jgi:hypothetical protein
MNAEIGIDEEGRAYVQLSKLTQTEQNLMKYMRSFLPLRYYEFDAEARIIGDRLPGSGAGVKAQDATK